MSRGKKSSAEHAAKRLARLAAVQALYRTSFEQETTAQIIRDILDREFANLRDDEDGGEAGTQAPDKALFGCLVEGVAAHREELDSMIAGALDVQRPVERMEILLRIILRAGVFELYHHAEAATGVIINDYVDVTRAFYDGKEPGLVNGLLDRIAGKLRGK